ncbi:uncharacterized protein LY79DRAFT_118524 [Colletotrichum navitas]|uniref:Uncharacterized protein n=1 Tax=Colletotrichum navitas TaxID=681940 RepID=A0AAD8Q362_9PEZI|nr:uncharacterized protein LY79DRAFT_118524 [Colletotrichum navitas]KAK1595081.1 hypothetical protein LY79DRAFT_118524 [Colletotrichum navitas]
MITAVCRRRNGRGVAYTRQATCLRTEERKRDRLEFRRRDSLDLGNSMWAASVRRSVRPYARSAFFFFSIVAAALAPGVRELGRDGGGQGRERGAKERTRCSRTLRETRETIQRSNWTCYLSLTIVRPLFLFFRLLLHVLLWTCGRSDKQRPFLTSASPLPPPLVETWRG